MDDGFFTGKSIGIAGLGLIGGSLALAFKRAGFAVKGYDKDPSAVAATLTAGAADEASADPAAILGCDVLFLALYPQAIARFVLDHAGALKPGAIVIDCCGVKGFIVRELAPEAARRGFVFLGGHPMAGTEKSGFSAARADLFCGASFILTPAGAPDEICGAVHDLLLAAGFGRVVVTTPEHHDAVIAFTSQLPHVLACAYVLSPRCPEHRGYSAGSYRDVSRVAHINPELWSELFLLNADALTAEIDALIGNLSLIRDAVAAGDATKLSALLSRARTIKDGVDDAN